MIRRRHLLKALADHGHDCRLPSGEIIPAGKYWTILVYCQEPSHSEKCFEIGEFTLLAYVPHGQLPELSLEDLKPMPLWRYQPRRTRHRGGRTQTQRRQRRQDGTAVFGTAAQHLIGDQVLPVSFHPGEFNPAAVAERYPLKCKRCGLSVPHRQRQNRGEDIMQDALDERLIAAVDRVSLRELAAILS
jgi:hypothetical protein